MQKKGNVCQMIENFSPTPGLRHSLSFMTKVALLDVCSSKNIFSPWKNATRSDVAVVKRCRSAGQQLIINMLFSDRPTRAAGNVF